MDWKLLSKEKAIKTENLPENMRGEKSFGGHTLN